jgi:hypothetical protein
MNAKRLLGETLRMAGAPQSYGLMQCFCALTYDKQIWRLLWAVPLTVTTLPLLPLWLIGDGMVKEVEEEEFSQRTKDLPTIALPEHYLWIIKVDNEWRIEPFYMDDEEDAFESEAEARLFVETLQYHEVLSKDCQGYQTFWIKDVTQSFAKTL